MDDARDICNTWFPRLLDELLKAYTGIVDLGNKLDVYDQLKKLLLYFMYTNTIERSLYRPLIYIKQHTSYLRHRTGISGNSINKCIADTICYLGDLVVLLCRITEICNVNLKQCAYETRSFYVEYHKYATINKISVRQLEPLDSLLLGDEYIEATPELPPQHQCIDWYRKNGYREFLKACIIIPDGGIWKDRKCKIIGYNGNNTRCSDITSNEIKLLSSKGYTITYL